MGHEPLARRLDDIRVAPDGWLWVKTAPEAIAALTTGTVDEISLDHDLGDDKICGTGYDVVCWIEEATRSFVPPKMTVHSKNCVGAEKMRRGIASIERDWTSF